VRIDLNDLKEVISISVTKNAPDAAATVEMKQIVKSRGKYFDIL